MTYFSFNNGKDRKPIALIEGGKAHGKIIYLGQDNDDDNDIDNKKCCDNCMEGCGIEFPKCCRKCKGDCYDFNMEGGSKYDVIFGREMKKVESGKLPFINIRDGVIIPIPIKKEAKEEKRENIFISGPEGAGKSTWAANYTKQFRHLDSNIKSYFGSGVRYGRDKNK